MAPERCASGASPRCARSTGNGCSFSVFECRLPATRLARMIGEIEDVIDHEQDSVIVYRFAGKIDDATLRLGRSHGRKLGQPWVL